MEVSEKPNYVGSPAVIDSASEFSADQRDMQRMGKKQEFKRNFNWFSSVAFTSCTMGTWEFVFINNFQGLVDGGRAGMFWGYCWVILGQFFVVLSLAEMSSMAPTAGGQYHWVSEFSPKSIQKISSYASGWLSALCWQSFVSADCIFTAQLLMAAVSTGNPSFSPELWQTSLLAMLIAVMVTSLNIWCSNRLPVIENCFIFLHIACFVIVMVTLGVTNQKTPARQVFLEFTDNGGNYPTLGLAVMVGQVSAMFNVCASDAVAHISEEVKDASIIAPRAMFWSFALNLPIAFAVMVMSLYTIPDVTVATTEYTFPFLSILENSSLPPAGVQAIASLMVVLLFMIAVSTFASTSRQCFAFARDQGLPASDWLRRVDPALNVPRNACVMTLGFTLVMCLVYLGSSVTFNAILSIGIVALMATYGLSTGCVLYRRLRWPETLPPARWSLGRWGILVNGIGVSYASFAFFWCFWPIYYSPTPETMNWAVVMFGGVMLLAVVAYFVRGRKMYEGPVATCDGRRID
ncbi:amino acid transporter [Diaporthe sp. PMI_573]|nr:amino acid transporter [Diaporthaceae sp. PMI_573]